MPPQYSTAPRHVVEYCNSPQFRSKFDQEGLASVSRLLADLSLAPLWEELTRPGRSSADVWLFLERCARLPQIWRGMPLEPSRHLERRLSKLAEKVDDIAATLRSSSKELEFHGTPLQLRQLFIKCSVLLQIGPFDGGLDFPESEESERRSKPTGLDALEPYDGLQVRPLHEFAVTHVLDALAISLRAAPQAPLYEVRPTKLTVRAATSSENPQRTFFARALAHFFLSHGGAPKYDLVALAVTALLDLQDDLLDESHVHHNCRDLERSFGDMSREEDDLEFLQYEASSQLTKDV